MINSDAHKPEEIDGYFDNVIPVLKNIGIKKIIEFNNSGKHYVSIN